MEGTTSYSQAVGYLEYIFDLLNNELFENSLSRPTVTIQSTPRAYGHFTRKADTWISEAGNTHEINIAAGTLARPIEQVVTTMLHEMVHYYNYNNGIQDCSRNGTYHNLKFKEAAEEHGLIVEKNNKYGWCKTSPSKKLLDFVLEKGLTDILIHRNEERKIKNKSQGSNSRKYICPFCGMSVRATKQVHIACLDCMRKMVLEVKKTK